MIALGLRILRGNRCGDWARTALTVAGTALGTVFLLCGLVVLNIGYADPRQIGSTCGTTASGGLCFTGPAVYPVTHYTSNLLNEPGLRPGVATAFFLLLLPVVVFLGQCARIAAARRDRRLAALRLAGATPAQVRWLAALDTTLACGLGVVVGLAAFLGLRAALEAGHTPGQLRTLPTDVPVLVVSTVIGLLLVPLLGGLATVVVLRRVTTSPLAVVRRRVVPRPSGWPALILLVGVTMMVIPGALAASGSFDSTGGIVGLIVLGMALSVIGLLFSAAWITGRLARLLARHTGRPALLLAARRLERDPYAQTRAMSAVLLCVLLGSAVTMMRASTLAGQNSDTEFYASAYDLVTLAVGVALLVAVTGLVVAGVEAVTERRRELAALVAAGTPQGTLRRALLAQSVLPAVPAVVVAVLAGAGSGAAFGSGAEASTPIPVARLLLVVAVAIAATAAATACTLPVLSQSIRPAELQYE